MHPGSREDAAEGVLPGDCGKDRALNSGHRAVAGCVPGAARSGVEGEIGRFRGRHMTPVPRAASLAELNQMLADADEVDEHRRIAARIETDGQAAAREVPLLNPLPGNAFQAAAALSCRVDAKAMICVRQSYYSVPARLAGRRGARSRWALTGSTSGMTGVLVARHTRSLHKGSENLVLDHLPGGPRAHRPGALAGATALVSARADRRVHRWAPTVLGHRTPQGRDRNGTKALIGVLLLHRTLPTEAVLAGIDAAVGGGAPSRSGPESSERVWGTLAQVSLHPRQFRVTGHAPRAARPSRSVDEHPRGEASFADRAWSSRGRPAAGSGVWCSPRDTSDSRGQIKPSSWGHIKLTEPEGVVNFRQHRVSR